MEDTKTMLEYVDILADKVNAFLKPLGINSQTSMESIRHMYIWLLVFDELREQLGYPGRPMLDLEKKNEEEGLSNDFEPVSDFSRSDNQLS